ncbi:unnamed protein product [Bursaphelenchus okinawaensis]|uniref:Transcription initiation factor TFIID subunit 12 n=1 Tax=Bursaphelenchus okinawaensis TaxID=465554 RepID=A0A811KJK0_9BILA|nr:unnamed protein product [Bursaphelenchus okinawaensis]CAG9104606.1 unnamed protein product [Bursaphelenchus okinawaensis]
MLEPVISKPILDNVAKAVDSSMVLEPDVKSGIVMYMESLVDDLIKETAKAATVRKSTEVKAKDIDFVLRKYNINVHGPASGQPSAKKSNTTDQRQAMIDRSVRR